MEPNEVIAAIKRALLEEEKKYIDCKVFGWVEAKEKEFKLRYLVFYTDGPKRYSEVDEEKDESVRDFVIKTTEDLTPESVMKD
ncbi:hypothetical protein MYX82_11785, partial [Acidobacteria bacterium AH-259-D05]|nr:hypothetical protein [Acidobacteria bacterium AH-259-D05]